MYQLMGRRTAGVSTDFNGTPQSAAWKFTADKSGSVKILWAQTKVANPTASAITLAIWDDTAGGARPGNRLGSAAPDSLPAARGTGAWSATLAVEVVLVAGTVYWLSWSSSTENFDFQGDASGSYVENSSNPVANPWPSAGNSAGAFNAILWCEDANRPVSPPTMMGP